jgi:hypothetical protein
MVSVNTYLASIDLFAGPTSLPSACRLVSDRINELRRIEEDTSDHPGQVFNSKENTASQKSIGRCCDPFAFCPIGGAQGSPSPVDGCGPISSNGLNVAVPISANSVSSQLTVTPAGNAPSGNIGIPDTTGTSEYELVAECRDFTVRVVWYPGTVISSPAVSGHDDFVFREVDCDKRPRFDSGRCRISYKRDGTRRNFPMWPSPVLTRR